VDRLVVGVAAWMQFVRRQVLSGATIVDPLGAALAAIGRSCSGVAADDVDAFLAFRPVFATELAGDPRLRSSLETAYRLLGERRAQALFSL
jgi:fructuronate reductase